MRAGQDAVTIDRDRPSLGLGGTANDAIEAALAPFEGIVDELLASLPGGDLG